MSILFDLKRAAEKQLSFVSPAKINLFFRVLCKREDCFHEIASLYQAISLYDTLKISLSEKDELTCSDSSLLMDKNNLVYKALQIFREKTGIHHPVKIHLEKNIPMEAGLGGGSSNAATTLFALSTLFSLDLPKEDLIQMGSVLGSDVPFFFSSGSAYCTGRGEILQDIPYKDFLGDASLWIAKPEMGLSTPLVYKSCKPDLLEKRDPEKDLAQRNCFYNDLEMSAFSLKPELETLKRRLLDLGFTFSIMSGSGTSFFCIGKEINPHLEGVKFFEVKPILRKSTTWYEI